MRDILDPDHPFFRPLWARVATVAVCIGWGAYEFGSGAPFWGLIFCSAGAYAGWRFVTHEPKDPEA